MSKTETKTATTVHGEVEYETVTCDSCGNEAAKEEASKFVMMHDMKDTSTWSHRGGYKEFEVFDYTEGWACKYCVDSPQSFPKRKRLSWFKKKYEQQTEVFILVTIFLLWLLDMALVVVAL